MRTYLQTRLTGKEGQVVSFDRQGRAVASDPPTSIAIQVHVLVIQGSARGEITVTARCGSQTIRKPLPPEEEMTLTLYRYGLWTVEVSAAEGTLVNSVAQLRVDTVRQYDLVLGMFPELERNPPAVISDVGRRGLGPKFWKVGDRLKLDVTGVGEMTMEILDFAHDTLAEGGTAPFTFGVTTPLLLGRKMNATVTNTTSWVDCALRAELNGTIFDSFPQAWKDVIRPVIKLTAGKEGTSDLVSSTDRLFLLSEAETFDQISYSDPGEGKKYPIFTDNISRQKKSANNQYRTWWLRSPKWSNTSEFCVVSIGGGVDIKSANETAQVLFGFCL